MEEMNLVEKMREKAIGYYMAGDFYCSETVVKVIHEHFKNSLPDDIVSLASGFPHGMGSSGCVCGALVGGSMALGMIFGRTAAKDDEKVMKTMTLTHELHDLFKGNHRATCCRVLTKNLEYGSLERKEHCARLAGEMTAEAARIIIRERGADSLKS